MAERDVLERLKWWLAYLAYHDEELPPDSLHPDFVDDPDGFDEMAICTDLINAIAEITRLRAENESLKNRFHTGQQVFEHYVKGYRKQKGVSAGDIYQSPKQETDDE